MIGMGIIDLVLRLVLATGHLEGRRPVSLLVIANPGTGKSEALLRYSPYPCMMTTSYISFPKLIALHGPDIVQGKLHHLLLPDLALFVSRPKWVVTAELAAFGSLIEEGIINWRTQKASFHMDDTSIGMVAATTPRTLQEARFLAPAGFLSRFMKFSYQYSEETKGKIRAGIRGRLQQRFPKDALHPKQRFPVTGEPGVFSVFEEGGFIDILKDPDDVNGFRIQQQLESLAMAQALLRGSREVVSEDVKLITTLCRYFRSGVVEPEI